MKKIVKKNANAIFASISKYNKNLTKIKVVDLKNNLLKNEPYFFLNQNTKYPIRKTDKFGMIYIYKNREKYIKIRNMVYTVNDTINTFIKE